MHLDGPEPILGMPTAAGFIDVTVGTRPDLSLGIGVPCLIIAADLEKSPQMCVRLGAAVPPLPNRR
jgi:hypothetical protein